MSEQSEREMLEWAAKAIGYDWRDKTMNVDQAGRPVSDWPYDWNPLIDDAAALRLAVELQLTICNEHVSAGTAYCTRGEEIFDDVLSGENEGEVIEADYAATRRAIVLAAAAIGRAGKGQS